MPREAASLGGVNVTGVLHMPHQQRGIAALISAYAITRARAPRPVQQGGFMRQLALSGAGARMRKGTVLGSGGLGMRNDCSVEREPQLL